MFIVLNIMIKPKTYSEDTQIMYLMYRELLNRKYIIMDVYSQQD